MICGLNARPRLLEVAPILSGDELPSGLFLILPLEPSTRSVVADDDVLLVLINVNDEDVAAAAEEDTTVDDDDDDESVLNAAAPADEPVANVTVAFMPFGVISSGVEDVAVGVGTVMIVSRGDVGEPSAKVVAVVSVLFKAVAVVYAVN